MSWAEKPASSIDLTYAALTCVVNDWPTALRRIVRRPELAKGQMIHWNHPLPKLFYDHYGTSFYKFRSAMPSSSLLADVLRLTVNFRSHRCFNVFISEYPNFERIFYQGSLVGAVIEEVKDPNGDHEKTLILQNKWIMPILKHYIENEYHDKVFEMTKSAFAHRNHVLYNFVMRSKKCMELFSKDCNYFESLASVASRYGLIKESLFFFDKQTKKVIGALYLLLESALCSSNLDLVEKIKILRTTEQPSYLFQHRGVTRLSHQECKRASVLRAFSERTTFFPSC